MIFTDGECPNCISAQLHINSDDFFECPKCHLVITCRDGLFASVLPYIGQGEFRFEDYPLVPLCGAAVAMPIPGSLIGNPKAIFVSKTELSDYLSTLPTKKQADSEGEFLCEKFLASFKQSISNLPNADLLNAWSSDKKRTHFYKNYLMPSIADQLELIHGNEEFKVDYVLSKYTPRGHLIPKIFVESENNYSSATHEIRKLCAINSPLRVLITQTDRAIKNSHDSPAHSQLREWQSIVLSNAEGNPDFKGIIAIVIGQKNGPVIVFHACAFRTNGDLSRPLSKLLQASVA